MRGIAAAGGAAPLAFSHNGFTYQSRFHLFSGSLAGVRGGRTLVDDFKGNGYRVGYFSGQDDSFGGPELAVGFDRADTFFDARSAPDRRYTQFSTPGSLAVPALGGAREGIRVRRRRRPRDADVPLRELPRHAFTRITTAPSSR